MSEIGKALNQVLAAASDGQTVTTLAEAVNAVATEQGASTRDALGLVAGQIGRLQASTDGNTAEVSGNTKALVASVVPLGASAATSWADDLGGVAKALLSGLTLSPVISGLLSLFRGGSDEPEGEPIAYTEPEAIHFLGTAAQGAGSPLVGIDYGQDGLPRLMNLTGGTANVDGSLADAAATTASATARTASGEAGGGGWPGTITVNVQAIDSRSFLDHSDAIANAVREAILNAHPLGEVVREI
jgi:hypothetical protein